MTYRLTWRGQPEPGAWETIDAAKAYAQANSHAQNGEPIGPLEWFEPPTGSRAVWWGSDGYNNWTILEANA
ncbi:hypothetical protein IU449_26790 [Nocardia higoensis]|uniref:Uncharacterized protein n=1 Tax=Nocardia higoensis TaxID=228599 RepID=A0ABS0DI23_9NOCA|nr:hypothetical protein [Nocardia higoensis]MBF6358107.1 hypothetical protein [Nocardia higoensis]